MFIWWEDVEGSEVDNNSSIKIRCVFGIFFFYCCELFVRLLSGMLYIIVYIYWMKFACV